VIAEKPQTATSEQILLVDDHAGFRQVVAEVLDLAPGSFLEASNGLEAVAACGVHAAYLKLILMDLDMPEMDGLAATREIRTRFEDVRVVILTQHDQPEIRAGALAAGANAFLSKMNLHLLPELITQLLKP
jgi:CheY-like chemotaxis protein